MTLRKVLPGSLWLLFVIGAFSACDSRRTDVELSDLVPSIQSAREPKVLTAFFGLDNALPEFSRLLYSNAPGQDGMPIVFSHELDPDELDGADFEITTQNGSKLIAEAATLRPANEAYELRTALLIGEFGNHPDNPPVSVKVIGDLMTRKGHNFKGETIAVIPLPDGPVLSYAEFFWFTNHTPFVAEGRGCDCPWEETKRVVRAVWSGGVRALNGDELGDNELNAFEVTMIIDKDTVIVHPFQLADLNDNDNNTDLCLREKGTPIKVAIKANTAIDPRDDPNPATEIEIVSRW